MLFSAKALPKTQKAAWNLKARPPIRSECRTDARKSPGFVPKDTFNGNTECRMSFRDPSATSPRCCSRVADPPDYICIRSPC